jgi:hypothetical protein
MGIAALAAIPIALLAGACGTSGGGQKVATAPPATGRTPPIGGGPACSAIGYAGQDDSAFVGQAQSFRFVAYNALPRRHKADSAEIAWGDGGQSAATASTAAAPVLPGCYVTTFAARHVYTRPTCVPPAPCGAPDRVAISYRDATLGGRLSLVAAEVTVLSRSSQKAPA